MMSHNPKKFYFDLMIYHIRASVRVQNLLGTEKKKSDDSQPPVTDVTFFGDNILRHAEITQDNISLTFF